jgi:protein ImuA
MDLLSTLNASTLTPDLYPGTCEPLEEVGAARPADASAALAFALSRLAQSGCGDDPRPWVMATTPLWLRERGRPFARGLAGMDAAPERLIWIRAPKEIEALWALEEALKSGAVAGGLVTAEQPAFVMTRRLDFAARAGGARGVVLRAGPALDLSAARMRWRIAAGPSAPILIDGAMFDEAAPGPPRLVAELVRRRSGPPGVWELEQDDETGGFRVVAGLADHGLAEAGPDRRRGDKRAIAAA